MEVRKNDDVRVTHSLSCVFQTFSSKDIEDITRFPKDMDLSSSGKNIS